MIRTVVPASIPLEGLGAAQVFESPNTPTIASLVDFVNTAGARCPNLKITFASLHGIYPVVIEPSLVRGRGAPKEAASDSGMACLTITVLPGMISVCLNLS